MPDSWRLLRAALRTAAAAPFEERLFLSTFLVLGSLLRPLLYASAPLELSWFLAGFVAQAGAVAALVVTERARRGSVVHRTTWAYLAVLLLSGAVGAYLFGYGLDSLGAMDFGFMDFVIGALDTAACTLLLHASFAVVGYIVREYQAVSARLADIGTRTAALRLGAGAVLQQEHAVLAEQARSELEPSLRDIQQWMLRDAESGLEAMAERLQEVIDSGLRPLSRAMLSGQVPVRPPTYEPPRARLIAFAPRLNLRAIFRPEFLKIYPLPLYLGTMHMVYGPDSVLPGLSASVIEFALMALIVQWSPERMLSRAAAIAWIVIVPVVAAIPASFVLYQAVGDPMHPQLGFALVFLREAALMPFFSLAVAYALSVLENLEAARSWLVRAEQEFHTEQVRQSQQLWAARRHWAYHIHGTVQSLLTAALLQLRQKPVDWPRVHGNLQQAVEALYTAPAMHLELDDIVRRLEQTWAGMCTLRMSIGDGVAERVADDWQALFTLNEALKEAVSNAVRHAQSRALEVSLVLAADELIVRVVGAEVEPAAPVRVGLGTELFDQIATEWRREGNDLVLRLPLAR